MIESRKISVNTIESVNTVSTNRDSIISIQLNDNNEQVLISDYLFW